MCALRPAARQQVDLYCGGSPGQPSDNLAPFNTLEFSLQLASGPPGQCIYPTVQLQGAYAGAGPWVPVSDYLVYSGWADAGPACVGAAWRAVRIPLAALGGGPVVEDGDYLNVGNTR